MTKIIFKLSLILIFFFVLFTAIVIPASADVVPPKKQAGLGISSDDIICETGMFKVIKAKDNSAACVKVSSVSKLVSHGWAKAVDEANLNQLVSKLNTSAGKINTLLVTPITTDFGKLSAKTSVSGYDYVFEVCASSQDLVSPEVLVRSDSETKSYELSETITKNTCVPSATVIKAASPESISAVLVSKGDISQIILSAKAEIDSLRQQILEAKQSFGKENTDANKQQGNKIADLRLKLNDAIADLHRMYFMIYTPVKSKMSVEKMSFSGTSIQGETATKISVSPSISTAGTYDVVFEACAGEKQVRIPIVIIDSDSQKINVKLGDKIAPKTCQLTSAKIVATDSQSISVKVAGNADSSNQAIDLEAKIADLQTQLISAKEKLKEIVHNPSRPDGFNEDLTSQVDKITKLRNEIISAKADLSKILYLTYQ